MKLTIHNQLGIPHWMPTFLANSGVRWLKIMDPGEAYPLPEFPTVNLIVRFWRDVAWETDLIWYGTDGADRWIDAHRPLIRQRPWLSQSNVYLEVLNEPHPMSNRQFRANLDLFTARVVRRLAEEFGVRACGHNWSVGWPDVGHATDFRSSIDMLRRYNGLLGLHEYGWPAMNTGNGFWTLRYRKTLQELERAGIVAPLIAITECGLDSGLVEKGHRGWQAVNNNPDWYINELRWYESELQKDPQVVCATIFTATPAPQWQSFEVTEALAMRLARLAQEFPAEPPPAPPRPGGKMKILDFNGTERDMAWLKQVYGGVTISSTGDDLYEVAELREVRNVAVLGVTMLDVNGQPQASAKVAFHWPDAPHVPGSGGLGNAAQGRTNSKGRAEFVLGRGSYYDPNKSNGPNAVWPWGHNGPIVSGLGMLTGSEYRHLDVVFEERPVSGPQNNPAPDPPPIDPPPTSWPIHDLRPVLEWNKDGSRWKERNTTSITQIVIHHTASEPGANQLVIDYIKAVNRYHIENRGWPRIGYHYVIGTKGVIWQCNDIGHITYHAGDARVNASSIGIALIGDLTKRDPTPQQLNALKWLCEQLGKFAIGHKEVVQTACPGNWWPFWKPWLNDWQQQRPQLDLSRVKVLLEEIKARAEEGLRIIENMR